MSDPLPRDAAHSGDPSADADKTARIEQLLLSGLDEYFSGQYEQAINIWTRVVFLERGHGRARAYIERARSALAERHRESDELLHRGMAAFNSGQNDEARDLITRAVEQGGSQDVAVMLLERLNRLATPSAAVESPRPAQERQRPAARRAGTSRPSRAWMLAAPAMALAAAALVAVASGAAQDWIGAPAAVPAADVAAPLPEPLPVARSSEHVVARARAFGAGGHVYDALQLLDAVAPTDPLRPEADRLRGELQRQLLEASR